MSIECIINWTGCLLSLNTRHDYAKEISSKVIETYEYFDFDIDNWTF